MDKLELDELVVRREEQHHESIKECGRLEERVTTLKAEVAPLKEEIVNLRKELKNAAAAAGKTLDKTKGDLERASELLKQAREFGWRKKLECDNYKRQLQEFKGAIIPLKEFVEKGFEPRATYRCPNGKEGCTYDGVDPDRHKKCKCTSSSSSSTTTSSSKRRRR